MRLSPAIVIGAFALAACGEREAAPTPAEKVAAAAKPSDAVQTAPEALNAADLRRVCRAGLAAVHGQEPMAINVDGVRMRADCRVEKDLIVWKPLDLPDPTLVRWMNQSDDPVIRYVMDGQAITITQTLPDGTKEQAELAVPAEEEAR